jgi:hypothetical protein
MKKAVSVVLLALLVCSTSLPAFGQKGKFVTNGQMSISPPQVRASLPKNEAKFAAVRAVSDGNGVWFEWEMEAERNNIGFFVYRIGKKGAQPVAASKLVEGSALRVGNQALYGAKYNVFDPYSSFRSVYYIEGILSDGTRVTTPTFAVEYVNDLVPFAGVTSHELIRRYGERNPTPESSALALPKDLSKEVAAFRLLADDTTHRAVISRPGVRIGVKKEGLYRITKAQLQAGGFDTTTDPSRWQLYVEGVEQALNIAPDASYIEFYGRGADTQETDIRIYFLITGDTAGKRFATRVVRPGLSTVVAKSFPQTAVRKERTQYIDDVINGDAENYWGSFIFSTPATYNFTLTGVDFSGPDVAVQIKFQGYSFTQHTVELTLNGQAVTAATGSGTSPYSIQVTLPVSVLREGANSLQMRSPTTNDFSFFDSISISYSRKFVAEQNQISFFTDNYRGVRLDGFASPNFRLLDLTDVNSPVLMTNLQAQQFGATYGANLPASRGRVYFGVEDSALLQAVSITPNNPALLSDPTNAANLVIISYKDFLPQAETWANYRRGQGTIVKVIEVSEIFDEFNYGQLSADSIKSFLQYATTNWQTPPQYALLIGDASFDSRNYEGRGFFNYVPSRVVNTSFSETPSDEALGDFNNDGLSEIAIGRIPARDAQYIDTVFNKVTLWESMLNAPLDRGGLFASDLPIGYDFQAMSGRLRNQLPSTMPVTMLNRADANSSTTLISEMNTGKYLVNYTGHGASGSWAATNFFTILNVPQLTNASKPSLYTSLSCLNGYFHDLTRDSLAEVLTKYNNGGAVAMWASSGETTPDVQEVLGARFFNQLGAGNITRLGDLIKDAKTAVVGGRSVRLSWVLIGDPMLKVR